MLGVMTQVVGRLKRSWAEELEDEAVRRSCREAGYAWCDRKLDPVTTVRLFLLQILWGNASQVYHLAAGLV